MNVWNGLKTTLLMGALMGLCLGVGYALGGGPRTMLLALMIGGAMNFIAYFFSDKIALATMHARQIGPDDDPKLWRIVETLCHQAGLPMPKVCVSPAAAPNAFATGRNPDHSAVCVTAGLRQILTDDELSGVIAHELSHIKHRDILISTVAATVAGAISYLAYMAMWFGRSNDEDSHPLVGLLMLIFAPIAATIIQLAVSRSREYSADSAGALISGSPRGLANALRKLDMANHQIPLHVPDSQSNMFIVAPLTGHGGMARLFMTHPPTEERIRRLMEMER